jgi:diaminopimelate decarboxylase
MIYPPKGLPAATASADVSSLRLVEEFPTPLIVHDTAVLRRRVAALRQVLPAESTLLYSLKANPLPPIVTALQGAGCGSEVSSLGELATALGAGPPPSPLFYTGPGKSVEELTAAVRAGAILACESAVEVARARDALARDAVGPLQVVLRVQPPSRPAAGLSMADGRQFGFLEDEAVQLCRSGPDGVEVLGFHCYLGSQIPTCEALLAAFGQAVDLVERLTAGGGIRPRIADLGGGFPWPYAAPGDGPDLTPLAADLDRLVAPLRDRGTDVWFESGRSLTAPAGRLLTTVMDVKQRGDRSLVVVDAGINILGGMSGLGRVLRPSTVLRNLTAPDGPELAVDVVGPLCTPLDRLSVNTTMATPHVGDVLCVDNAGAYATTAALSAFLSRPAAVELVTDGGEVIEAWALRSGHVPVALGAGQEAALSTRKPM